jgi:formate hydrogenlyase subunit 3/multisubunit Na+/H+ antiporter MnhD subunit
MVIPIMALGIFYLIFKILEHQGLSRKTLIILALLGIIIGGLMSFEE